LTRALAAGALERSVDLAAALEVRGYARAPRRSAARDRAAPLSRHDVAFALAALASAIFVAAALWLGTAVYEPYPAIEAAGGLGAAAFPVLLIGAMIAPFGVSELGRRRLARGDRAHARPDTTPSMGRVSA
jgi:energy-coupling factor transport system permease protein